MTSIRMIRLWYYLGYIAGTSDVKPPAAVTRTEQLLERIARIKTEPIRFSPLTRQERYLAKISGMDVTIPEEPIGRYETFLARWAGQEVEHLKPTNTTEKLLYTIIENKKTSPAHYEPTNSNGATE